MRVSRVLLLSEAAARQCERFAGTDRLKAPQGTLKRLYTYTLAKLEAFPPHAVYAQAASRVTRERLAIVETAQSVQEIENRLSKEGPIEFLVEQATAEYLLAIDMFEYRCWEPQSTTAPVGQWDNYPHTRRNHVLGAPLPLPQRPTAGSTPSR